MEPAGGCEQNRLECVVLVALRCFGKMFPACAICARVTISRPRFSPSGYNALFYRLSVSVEERGESTYVSLLPSAVRALIDGGAAVLSDGAWVVPLPPDGAHELPPMLIQKRDGRCVLIVLGWGCVVGYVYEERGCM